VPTVLVTAFEPSGDAHAAPLVRALRAMAPDVRVVGWGGPRMREAGCEMAGETARDGAMTLVGLKKIQEVRRIVADIRTWAAKKSLMDAFRAHTVHRRYLAIVHGEAKAGSAADASALVRPASPGISRCVSAARRRVGSAPVSRAGPCRSALSASA
jgi:hypothetical protein